MIETGVMQILDTLAVGGAERAAVNLANELPRDKYRSYLCATRSEGPLRGALSQNVGFFALRRKNTIDPGAIRNFVNFVRKEKISILHAHGSSIFFAALAARCSPRPNVIWHAHYGRPALEDRRSLAHRLALRRAAGVITVNQQLSEWCIRRLGVAAEKVSCIPNMVCRSASTAEAPELPGAAGSRIVCVANLREEKDHLTLIRAMALVVQRKPDAHLLLVGAHSDSAYSASSAYFESVKREVSAASLEGNVSFLGQRLDISAILHGCDVGVLSSKTEGLPVSLLEYGLAGLAVVATNVGECEEVLDRGRAGKVVPSQSPKALGDALLALLESQERRVVLGAAFRERVQQLYSKEAIVTQICRVYEDILAPSGSKRSCADRVPDRVHV
jgi:glycosyltransferase involved in cell wall biosynthesis